MNSGRAILPVPEGIFFIIFLVCLCFDYNQPHEVKGRIPYLYGVMMVFKKFQILFFFLNIMDFACSDQGCLTCICGALVSERVAAPLL